MIDEVLDLSRVESGSFQLNMEAVNIFPLLEELTAMVKPIADQHGIKIINKVRENDSWGVQADKSLLKQGILNLLTNAVKYNHKKGTVTLACSKGKEDTLRINVSDTGPGIPEEGQATLFEPFERLGAEHSGVEGTGIGLAITKKITEIWDWASERLWIVVRLIESPDLSMASRSVLRASVNWKNLETTG